MPQRSSGRVEMVMPIYENVDAVRGHNPETEQEDTDAERRLETKHTGGDTAWSRCYRFTAVCLLLLCILLLTAISLMWIKFNHQDTENNLLQTRYKNLTIERDQLQTRYNNLTNERDQLQTRYKNLTNERDQLLTRYNTLTTERDQLLRERERYLRTICDSWKWKCFSSGFYYMSNEKKTWDESRNDCRDKGADLVIINSKEEQEFIGKQLGSGVYWIGLSEGYEEGKWKWVDDTPVNTGYWDDGQLNDNSHDADCAEIYSYSNRIICNHKKCSYKQHWICEKRIFQ